jgi:phage terminase large subunit
VIIDLGSDWRAWQQQVWPAISKARTSVLVIHRGAGKTILACMRLLGWALERAGSTSAYIGPQQTQVRKFVWPLMRKLYSQVPGAEFHEQDMRVDLPGNSRLFCLGAENAHAIRGATLDGGVVLDEIAQIGPLAYGQVIYPAMTRPGVDPRCLIIGTPLGMANLFYQLYQRAADTPGWYRQLLTVDDTGLYTAEELAQIQAEMTPEDYAQEMLCDWNAAVRGSFYGQQMTAAERENRIGNVPHDPILPVDTSWDLGFSDLTVVWFWQRVGAEVRAIECLAFQSTALPDVVAELRKRPYQYRDHYLPHDAKVRELGTGRSRVEILQALGLKPTVVPQQSVADGIEATRTLLPRVWFDRVKCGQGVEALKTYRTDWDDELRVFSKNPLHSWESHYADGVRYFALGGLGVRPDRAPIKYRDRVVA